MKHSGRKLYPTTWELILSYWVANKAPLAWSVLLITILLHLALVFINLYLNNWQTAFYRELQHYNHAGFITTLLDFSIVSAVYIIISGCQVHFQMKLQIHWRQWLTETYLDHWLYHKTYYYMNLLSTSTDNPDQRISEDIQLFIAKTLTLFFGLLKQFATLVSFIMVLWHLSGSFSFTIRETCITIPGYLVWAVLVYSIVGTWLTTKVGRILIPLTISQQNYEADFRYALVRLRENDIGIASYHGEYPERNHCLKIFCNICYIYRKIINRTMLLTWITTGYSQLSIVFAFFVASPRYFNADIELGQLFEISGAYWYVHSALSYFINSFTSFAEWRSVLTRLSQFTENMHQAQRLVITRQALTINPIRTEGITIKNICIHRPDNQLLLNNLSLQLQPVDKLLIIGPSGCGKSTLLRTLLGIWPFSQGQIQLPAKKKMLLIPQAPYIPLNSLREVLMYPGISKPASTESLEKILIACKLSHLVNHLDGFKNWQKVLSLGEQQRLAIARAILHQPDWLLLDEATSALDLETERYLYTLLVEKNSKIGLITVGHQATLYNFHTLILKLDGLGMWQLVKQKR